VGKNGLAQRISCSPLEGMEESWEVKRKWRVEGGGGLTVRPSARALVLADVIAHLTLLLELQNSRDGEVFYGV